MTIVNVQQAKTHLSRLLTQVEAGEEVVLARAGVPVARLSPIEALAGRELGFVAYRVPDAFFEPLPTSELDAWEH